MSLSTTAAELATVRVPLARATTLPAKAFTDEAVYASEVERIFRGKWLCAGRVDQIEEPGDWQSLDLLGERLVIAHGLDGQIRVLSRVCRHRAAALVEGRGKGRSFRCPYHSWTYSLEGELIGAPHMDGADGFERKDCRLPETRSEIWEGFIFVNIGGEAAPLATDLAPLSQLLAEFDLSTLVAVETETYSSDFNWKVLVDNFMEAYHHIATHKDTLQPIFPATASHIPDNEGPYSFLIMPTTPDHTHPDGPKIPGIPDDQQPGLIAAVVYPFHLFAPAGDSMAWYQLLPESVDRFTLKIYTCFRKEALATPEAREATQGLHALTRTIHGQDITACESVWAGLQSGHFERGRLSPLEKAIWQFNQWWATHLAAN